MSSHEGQGDICVTLSGQYHKCPSFAALTLDIYDKIPQAIKLISTCPSYDNLHF